MQSILLASRRRDVNRISDLIAALRHCIVCWHRRARQRQSLADLDGRMLADIGISPADRDVECAKAFWQI
jgi:uncharacterized protein YjiS (DUF1127 family)